MSQVNRLTDNGAWSACPRTGPSEWGFLWRDTAPSWKKKEEKKGIRGKVWRAWNEWCSLDYETTTGVVNVKWNWTSGVGRTKLKAHQKPLGADQNRSLRLLRSQLLLFVFCTFSRTLLRPMSSYSSGHRQLCHLALILISFRTPPVSFLGNLHLYSGHHQLSFVVRVNLRFKPSSVLLCGHLRLVLGQ